MEFGVPELLIILVIVVLIFGPGRIASLARDLGTGIREFREGISGSKGEANELSAPEKDMDMK
ncbi:MAG TPA: twin-arginine translocase TatA/TatE family subunit [Anaerolineales bacterium]|nr:twin-arginine translocase TatA/TatE family subunit [Anaerolineales bacterium]